ncbi:Ig-like domain-containing protein [Neobacillus drentensis]|nr:Ig-like domain-containing protein [Neobacillus drentensis]
MKARQRKYKSWTSTFMAALLLISTFLPSGLGIRAHAEQADHIVISQVYGGGGNGGAVFTNDFIELYNPTDSDVSLDGWSVQWTSATGPVWTATPLAGTIKSHGFYLIQEAAGTSVKDKPLPTPDATGSLGMGAGTGKVVLVNSTTLVTGQYPQGVVDFVGYGTGTVGFEGTGPTKSPTASLSVMRIPYANTAPASGLGNAWDTNDNALDFVTVTPNPRNSSTPVEAPMVPVISLQPKGNVIQFLLQDTTATVKGGALAAEPGSTVNVYGASKKGAVLGTATAGVDGSFEIIFTSETAPVAVYVAAKQGDLDESTTIQIDKAITSTSVAVDQLNYMVTGGVGTLIGNAGAAAKDSIINVYPNATATAAELLTSTTAGTTGDFNVRINSNAPDKVYVTQQSTSNKGIMLPSAPVAVEKAVLTTITPLNEVKATDSKGILANLNGFFTVEGVVTIQNGILGTQKNNFYIQDATGGINVFGNFDSGLTVQRGDKLRVTGKVIVYNGMTEFEPTAIQRLDEGLALPTAKDITILDLNTFTAAEPLEGSLVKVTGKVSAVVATGTNYNVTFLDENNKATTLRVMGATGIKPDTDLVIGKSYSITGIVGQYTTNATHVSGYQVFPRDVKDIASILGITHTPLKQVYKDTNVEFVANADGADSVTVYYRAKGATDYTPLIMGNDDTGRYTATLDAANVPVNGFDYYIEAIAGMKVQSAGTSEAPNSVAVIEDITGPAFSGETPQKGAKVETPHPEISVLINDPSGVNESSVQMWLDGTEIKAPEATLTKMQVKYTPTADLTIGVHTVKVSATDTKENTNTKEWTFEIVPRFAGGNHYRGTTHNHTNISHDGAGSPEAALQAGQKYNYDWFAFSDHSHDIDPEKLGTDTVNRPSKDGKTVMQERSGGTQWQTTKDLAKQYTKNGEYVVFPAFEMTSTTWGHSNIFGTDNFIDRNINGKQYQDLNQYYAWVLTYDNIVGQFNHPDMSANAFNNFKPYNSDVDKLFTMLEVGNGSGHYGYANAETKYFSTLDLGWHLAPTYGEDNHEGTWGQINARTVIVADDLSQDSLMNSMRNMRVYMEEDPNFTLDVSANGYYMGSTVDSKKLSFDIKGSDLVAEAKNSTDYNYLPASYKSDDRIAKVELISNGNKVVDSITPMEKDFTWKPNYTVTSGQQWFVVKVTQMDGERIYSSPIWSKEESVDVKVNGIDIDGGVIVGGNPATLKAAVANNGTETIKNLKVDFYYDEVKSDNLIGTNNISSILSKASATATATWTSPIKGDHKIIAVVTSLDGLDLGDVQYTLPVKIKEPLGIKVLIDANHANENTSGDSGTYKDNLKAFTLMLQKEGYTVAENKTALTDDVLSTAKVLVLTHGKALTADEKTAVGKFVKNGGSLLMAGKSNNSTDPTINNGVLSEMGSSIRMGNDGVFDDSKSGNFWSDPAISPFAVRVHPKLVANHITDRVSFVDYYSGTSLSGVDNQALTETGKVTILAKGNETTYQGKVLGGYSYDVVSDATGGSAIPLIASEEIGDNGRVVVSGMNIFNDKQMDESFEPKGNDELIFNAVNWLAHREMKVATIADVRKLAEDTDVVVEGTVTTGSGVFFDAFNLQDETGGIMAFQEVPDGALKPGDKVRVYGHMKTFDNNKELEFTSFAKDVIKIGSGAPVEPKLVATGEATSAANQGFLVKVKGQVVSKFDENSYVINDGSGDVLVFTDGYIVNQSNVQVPALKIGDTLEAVGLSGAFAQGTRIRVRDTRELVGTIAPDTTAPVVTGVENNGLYNTNVKVSFNEGTATLNNEAFANETVVSAEGIYTLVVTDEAGNKTTVTFTIDKTAPVVSGVKDGIYNQDVTITFDDGKATLNGNDFISGTTVSADGAYTFVASDEAGNKTTVTFTIDKTAPVVTGVEDNGLYNREVTVSFNEGTATINGKEMTSGTVVWEEGTYTLVITDAAGNKTTIEFTIDTTAPVVTGVEDGIYNQEVTITFEDGTATLDGKDFTSGTKVSAEGTYTLVVVDKAGNPTTIHFVIDKTAPSIIGAADGNAYNTNVSITFEEGTATLNKVAYASGDEISAEGAYTLVVTDKAGNKTTVSFTIDKTAPVVTGVDSNGLYNHNVTISFNEGTAILNDKEISKDEVVSAEGTYTLVVTDEAGNKTTVTFTIDKTAPAVSGVTNNAIYTKDVTISFTEGTATLDGNPVVKKPVVVTTEGKHTFVLTDDAGNKTTVSFTIDKTAPVVTGVTNNGLYNKDVTISFNEGTAKLNGTTITNKALVKAQGSYTLEVINAAGLKTIIKFTIDKTAPTVTKIYEVSDKAVKVTGKTEAYATVKLYIAGKYQRSVTADKNGNFSFSISKQKAGTEIKVYAIDKAGNVSKAVSVKVVDKTAPATPSVNKVTVKSTSVTGRAEAGSKVTVKVGSKVLGTATTDKYGKFSVKISKQLAGKVLSVTAKDKAGNTSAAKKTTVKKK